LLLAGVGWVSESRTNSRKLRSPMLLMESKGYAGGRKSLVSQKVSKRGKERV